MKKLLIPVMVLAVGLGMQSCSTEPETVTETVTVTNTVIEKDTVTEVVSHSVALYLEKFDQSDWGSSGFGAVYQDYTLENISDVKIDAVKIVFEAMTTDNSKYTSSDYVFDIDPGDQISGQGFISVASKECNSVRIKEIEVTVY